MASAGGGVSGSAVAVLTLGAVFIYAGFRGVTPLQALRDAAGGTPPPVIGHPTAPPVTGGGGGTASGLGGDLRRQVVAAAESYRHDEYSQLKRTKPDFSDCSSFVDKALKDAGIAPPFSPWANTANYRMSPEWRTITAAETQPGDIAVSAGHMVLITAAGGTAAIGQQRTGVNVQTGSVPTLFGSQPYVYKTWTGYGHPTTGGGGGGGGGGTW